MKRDRGGSSPLYTSQTALQAYCAKLNVVPYYQESLSFTERYRTTVFLDGIEFWTADGNSVHAARDLAASRTLNQLQDPQSEHLAALSRPEGGREKDVGGHRLEGRDKRARSPALLPHEVPLCYSPISEFANVDSGDILHGGVSPSTQSSLSSRPSTPGTPLMGGATATAPLMNGMAAEQEQQHPYQQHLQQQHQQHHQQFPQQRESSPRDRRLWRDQRHRDNQTSVGSKKRERSTPTGVASARPIRVGGGGTGGSGGSSPRSQSSTPAADETATIGNKTPTSVLYEYCLKRRLSLSFTERSGVGAMRVHVIAVLLDGSECGVGSGVTKSIAKHNASAQALQVLGPFAHHHVASMTPPGRTPAGSGGGASPLLSLAVPEPFRPASFSRRGCTPPSLLTGCSSPLSFDGFVETIPGSGEQEGGAADGSAAAAVGDKVVREVVVSTSLGDAQFSALLYSMWQIDPRMSEQPQYEYREATAAAHPAANNPHSQPLSRHTFHCSATITLVPEATKCGHENEVEKEETSDDGASTKNDHTGELDRRENSAAKESDSVASTVPTLSGGTRLDSVEESILEAELSRSLGAAQLEDDNELARADIAVADDATDSERPSPEGVAREVGGLQAEEPEVRVQTQLPAASFSGGGVQCGVATTLSAVGVGPTKKDAKHAASKLLLTQLFEVGCPTEALRLANSAKHAFAQSKRSKRHALWEPSHTPASIPRPFLQSSSRPTSPSPPMPPAVDAAIAQSERAAIAERGAGAPGGNVSVEPRAEKTLKSTAASSPTSLGAPREQRRRNSGDQDAESERPTRQSFKPLPQHPKRRRNGGEGAEVFSPDEVEEDEEREDAASERHHRPRTSSSPPRRRGASVSPFRKRDSSGSSSPSREKRAGGNGRDDADQSEFSTEVGSVSCDPPSSREAKKNRAAANGEHHEGPREET